jgi:peptidoglycan-associated lipoprotein
MSKIAVLSLTALLASACTCKPHKRMEAVAGGPGDGNVSYEDQEGPLKKVYFAFDSYALSSTAKDILRNNADWLKANPNSAVEVEGHCDERGTNEYNMVLGANRARAAADYLRSLGVGANRLQTRSYGEELPADPAHNEEAWAKNRRAAFRVK